MAMKLRNETRVPENNHRVQEYLLAPSGVVGVVRRYHSYCCLYTVSQLLNFLELA